MCRGRDQQRHCQYRTLAVEKTCRWQVNCRSVRPLYTAGTDSPLVLLPPPLPPSTLAVAAFSSPALIPSTGSHTNSLTHTHIYRVYSRGDIPCRCATSRRNSAYTLARARAPATTTSACARAGVRARREDELQVRAPPAVRSLAHARYIHQRGTRLRHTYSTRALTTKREWGKTERERDTN